MRAEWAWAICAVAGLCSPAAHAQDARDNVVGRQVADLLRDAQSVGIRIVFSDWTVPRGLRVTQQPHSNEPLERLTEVLHFHGLKLDEISPGTYVVVREPASPPPPRSSELPQEVHVSASRYSFDTISTAAPFGLDGAQIEQQPALLNDATRSIRRFPGTAGQDLSSRTFVRGGTPDDNLVLLDGVPLYDPFHLSSLPINVSVIDPAVIGHVDFYSGVMPVDYGNRMGGLTNLTLREPGPEFGGRVAFGALDASSLFSGPLANGRGDWLTFARRGLLGRFVQMDRPELGRPNLFDGLGRMRYRLYERSALMVGGLVAGDTASVRGEEGRLSEDDSTRHRYNWIAYDRNGERLESRTLLTQTSVDSSHRGVLLDRVGSHGSLDDTRRYDSTLLRQSWALASDGPDSMRWGVSLRADRARFDFSRVLDFQTDVAKLFQRPASTELRFEDTVWAHQQEAYFDVTRALSRRWILDLGVHGSRAEYSTHQSSAAWDPRAAVRFDWSSSTRLRYSIGWMTQIWSAAELPIELDSYRFEEPSRSHMEVLALEHDFGSWLSLRGEVFDKRITHGRQRLENLYYPEAFLPELRADRLRVTSEGGEMFGFDLYLTAAFSERLAGWLSYSASSVKDTVSGYEFAPRAWEQQHSGGLGLTWSAPMTVVTAEIFAHSNWPLVPLLQGFVATGEAGEPMRPGYFLGSRDPRGHGYYLSLNLRGEHTFALQSGAVHVALDVSNATNRHNVCCSEVVFYPKPSDAADTTPLEVSERHHWLPLEPYLSVAWEF